MRIAARCTGAMEIAAGVGAHRPAASPSFECPPGDKALSLRRLGRGGSPAAFRSPAPGSPEPPRFEPLLRGSFREKVVYSNLNRRSDRIPAYGQDQSASAAPRKRQNGSGFTLHSPPAIPIAALQPTAIPIAPLQRSSSPALNTIEALARIAKTEVLSARSHRLCRCGLSLCNLT